MCHTDKYACSDEYSGSNEHTGRNEYAEYVSLFDYDDIDNFDDCAAAELPDEYTGFTYSNALLHYWNVIRGALRRRPSMRWLGGLGFYDSWRGLPTQFCLKAYCSNGFISYSIRYGRENWVDVKRGSER
jgi:hypothetical protein